MVTTMEMVLGRAGLTRDDIDYVNAHATGTLQGDAEEALAIAKVFGDKVPVSSLKGHLGHSLAACGTLEVIACVKMMQAQEIIPTRNLSEVDSQCQGLWLLKDGERITKSVKSVMSNNFAFGGMNTSLILRKLEG